MEKIKKTDRKPVVGSVSKFLLANLISLACLGLGLNSHQRLSISNQKLLYHQQLVLSRTEPLRSRSG